MSMVDIFYSKYRGQCIGRLMHFCYSVTSRADSWTFNATGIFDGNVRIGSYHWEGETDIPVIEFTKEVYNIEFAKIKEMIIKNESGKEN